MGASIAKLFNYFWGNEEARILFIGLDAAGKTTLLYKMKLGEIVTTIPTIGFNVETIEYKGLKMTSWDVGGRGKTRALVRHYLANTDALIFVVDSNDRTRMEEARDDLHKVLREDEVRHASLLVLANKQDLPSAMTTAEVTEALGLHEIDSGGRQWYIQASCATSGDGIYEGLDWLCNAIRRRRNGEWVPCGPSRPPTKVIAGTTPTSTTFGVTAATSRAA